jgi:hypothetical protein
MASDPQTVWTTVEVPRWYRRHYLRGEHHPNDRPNRMRTLEIVSDQRVWYRSGDPAVPLRYVLIREPRPAEERPKVGESETKTAPPPPLPEPGSAVPPMPEAHAVLCTDLNADPVQIMTWYAQRWSMETTFHEVRTHLGVESQRQWSDKAIARSTPALLGLFSVVALLADKQIRSGQALWLRQAAWYEKQRPTFVDALAAVRRSIWEATISARSPSSSDRAINTTDERLFLLRLSEILCYAPAKG